MSDNNRIMRKVDEQKCHSVLYNLIKAGGKIDNASAYIAEFFETARCDSFYNLSDCRKDYEDYLGKERVDRILGATETELDVLFEKKNAKTNLLRARGSARQSRSDELLTSSAPLRSALRQSSEKIRLRLLVSLALSTGDSGRHKHLSNGLNDSGNSAPLPKEYSGRDKGHDSCSLRMCSAKPRQL
jgi:hypothetical protein